MYRHSADSIKESTRKQFITRAEKEKFNNYNDIFIEKSDVYDKDEIDEIVSDLDFCTEIYNGQFINVEGTHTSTVELHEIEGNSINQIHSTVQYPVMENGAISVTTGENVASTTTYRTKDYISVCEEDVLTICNNKHWDPMKANIIKYDINKNFIESTRITDGVYTVGSEKFIRIYYSSEVSSSLTIIKNTVDHYNLLSLGKLQEDGQYKISITTSGKNIIGDKWEQGSVDGINGSYTINSHQNFYNRIRSKDFLPIDKSKNVITYSAHGKYKAAIRFFDSNKNFIYVDKLVAFVPSNAKYNIEIPANASYYKIIIADIAAGGDNETGIPVSPESVLGVDLMVQFEYGTEKTEYVPYKCGSVCDIVIPCKLERIGDISDRLFRRRDGKWCIEKNIKTRILSSSDKFTVRADLNTELTERYSLNIPDLAFIKTKYYPVFSNKIRCVMRADSPGNNITETCTNIFGHNDTSYIHVKRLKNETLFTDVNSLNQLMLNSELKYVTSKPELIELDDVTQGLLNSLDDVTCVFVTDSNIQPSSIRVSLSKTLMSTTSVLSKSIGEIDKQVSRISSSYENIKSVHSTSNGSLQLNDINNGVCEDVKIEGKTLLNLHSPVNMYITNHDSYDDATGFYTFTGNGTYKNLFTNKEIIKTNTKYTIFVECVENTLECTGEAENLFVIVDSHASSSFIHDTIGIKAGETGVKILCLTSASKLGGAGLRSYLSYTVTGGHIKLRVMLIEGDHTDKPLSYFKGVKSVGDDLSVKYLRNLATARQNLQTGLTYDSSTKTYKSTFNGTRYVTEPISTTNNKTYTLAYEFMCNKDFTVTSENAAMICRIDAEDASGAFVKTYAYHEVGKKYTAGKWYNIATKFTVDNSTVKRLLPCIRNNVSGVTEMSMGKVMVIEGDYTTSNLPYFEGEKSIDTPITISSINLTNLPNVYEFKDMNIADATGLEIATTSRGRITTDFIDISDNLGHIEVIVHGNRCDKVEKICFYKADKTYITHTYNTFKQKILRTDIPKDAVYARIVFYTVEFEKPFGVYVNTKESSLLSDIKSIKHLQYGDWQPTILRSLADGVCDTIEKHSDGKYYYHKRCGVYTVNSDSDIKLWVNPDVYENTECFMIENVSVNQSIDKTKNNGISTSLPYIGYHTIFKASLEGVNINNDYSVVGIRILKSRATDVESFKEWLNDNPITIVYELKEEEVYECSNIDLMLFNGGTTIDVHSGPVIPTVTLRTTGYIGNTINSLKNRVLLMENMLTEREAFHNRLMLNNRYSADKANFNVDILYTARQNTNNVDIDLIKLITQNIMSGTNNYRREYMEELIDFYTMIDIIPFEIADTLFELIESQYSTYTEIEEN